MSLKINIYSLSLKHNSPLRDSVHGYSYIFDLRCLPNPGREAVFKDKTGKDQEVMDYLEKIPEVKIYFDNVLNLVNLSIVNYLNRGFELLSVGFGCTGGQHRSVYFAESLNRELSGNHSVRLTLLHLNLRQ